MIPPHQRLEPVDASGAEVDDRLIPDDEFLVLDGSAQIGVELQSGHGLLVHSLVEHLVPRFPGGLGVIHCGVGVAEQVVGCVVLELVERDPDAGAGEYLAAAELERCGQLGLQAFGDEAGISARLDAVQQDHELVAADAGDRVALDPGEGVSVAEAGLDALGNPHQ